MSTKTYIFENPSLYDFDSDLIEIVDNKFKLKLKDNPGLEFTEDFSSDTGFTYDNTKVEFAEGVCRQKANNITENYNQDFSSDIGFTYDNTKAEFVGGVCRQISQRVENATFGATYTNNINGSWGNGTLTGTAYNGASVSGGKLVLGGIKYLDYAASGNASSQQLITIRFRYTPAYSGAPSSYMVLFSIQKDIANYANMISLRHELGGGNLFLSINNNLGNSILQYVAGQAFLPIAGTEYEFEINIDLTTGAQRIFIDGVQFGVTQTATGTRDSSINLFRIGAQGTLGGVNFANGSFNDVMIFSTVQHTANFFPGYTVLETDYLETIVTSPIQNYNYNILSFAVPTIVDINTPHYVVNGYYWNGTAWVTSSNTYATAMTYAVWISNISSFPAGALSTGVTIKIIFQDSNVLSSIDNITFTINEYTYVTASVICPEMEYTGTGTLVSFDEFTTTETESVRYTLQIGRSGNYLYWNGTAWATSDGTYTQATSKADFNTHKSDLPVLGKIHGQFKVHFTNTNIQSNIDTLTVLLTAQIYSSDNPTVNFLDFFENEGIESFIENAIKTGLDQVKYILSKDENYYYYNGSNWIVSNQTYSQSNTALEIQNNISTFEGISTKCYIKMLIHSESGTTTPYITSISITYGILPIEKCSIYGFCLDETGIPIEGVIIKVKLIWPFYFYDDFLLFNSLSDISTITNENGYWNIELMKDTKWVFTFIFENNRIKRYIKTIPTTDFVNFIELAEG